MTAVCALSARLARHEAGQDLIEYALLAALIALAAVVSVGAAGEAINAVLWQGIADTLSGLL
jgi:Flp pilus assembly pilin Flp